MQKTGLSKTFYIIRHGETDFNRMNIVQGSGVDTSLNETGRAQARRFFDTYRQHPFDKVYTSALRRSIESVQGFIDLGIRHEKLPELNEISWGDFEGKTQTAAQKAMYVETVGKWNAGDFDAMIPNGESPLQMQARQKIAIRRILDNPDEKQVLVCMHGRAMKSFLCLLLEEPLTKMEDFQHRNLCLYKLNYAGGKFALISANDIAHL